MKQKNILLTGGVLFLCGALFAAKITDEDIYKRYKFPILDQQQVLATLNGLQQKIINDDPDNPTLTHGHYAIYAQWIKQWLDFRYFEVDTNLARNWCKKVYTIVDFMAQCKDYLKTSKNLRKTNRPGYHKTIENFDKAREMFAELLKKQEKPDPATLKKLREEKKKWMAKAKEKLEAEARRQRR